jgi:hypothetical protein
LSILTLHEHLRASLSREILRRDVVAYNGFKLIEHTQIQTIIGALMQLPKIGTTRKPARAINNIDEDTLNA